MDRKRFNEMWGSRLVFHGCRLEALSAFYYHDLIFSGPMAAPAASSRPWLSPRPFSPRGFCRTKKLPCLSTHPLYLLFPDFVQQLKSLAG